jgi:hypothetical protein
MCEPKPGTMDEKMPLLLRPWVSLYRATPKIFIPGTDVDINFSFRFAILFSILRLSIRHALYHMGWPVGSKDTYFVSACMASFTHCTLILPGLAAALWSQPYVPSGKMEGSPAWYRDATRALMGFCTGYMIYDSIMGYVVETWVPGVGPVLSGDDITYLGHHILTSLYMLSSMMMGAGHMSAMSLMFNGEFTAPLMNLHLMMEKALEQDCCKGLSWLPTTFALNEQLFSAMYVLCRVAISPFNIGYISYQLLLTRRGRSDLPVWLSLSWMPMCWGVQFGSIPWIETCIETLKNGPLMQGGVNGEL